MKKITQGHTQGITQDSRVNLFSVPITPSLPEKAFFGGVLTHPELQLS